eukprot:Gregarina_sp_Poly_1__11125@NODE_89_length_14957_cov_92_057623_g65_i1_p2_GENE_NODE_89_length_14957_cov_92_057623_g65_i1NODE_89_length_14957_cov_92_057623_g65_i1_p2_ORF_typecomplete_len553_score101_02_NODE_89_length_14957_cov_92_057623_g65_i149256583
MELHLPHIAPPPSPPPPPAPGVPRIILPSPSSPPHPSSSAAESPKDPTGIAFIDSLGSEDGSAALETVSSGFLERLRKVRTHFTPSLALLSATSDRIRVSSPRSHGLSDDDQPEFPLTPKSRISSSLAKFKDRVRHESKLTERNGYFQEGEQRYSVFPEEYYDYCYVFHTHPADFGEDMILSQPTTTSASTSAAPDESSRTAFGAETEPLIPDSSGNKAAREAHFKALRELTLTRDEIRFYLSHACSYRDRDGVLQAAQSSGPNYFSSFSLAVHHHPAADRSIFQNPSFRLLFANIFGHSRRSVPPIEGVEMQRLQEPAPRIPEGSMSPPLAVVRDDAGIERFVTAGASTLPPFYGLQDFLEMLNEANEGFEMTLLDFALLVREMFTSCLKKAGADITEFMSSDGCQLMVKARLREKPCRRIANHIEYNCQCDRNSSVYNNFQADSDYVAPFVAFDENAESLHEGWYAARNLRRIWRRYDGLSREVKFPMRNLLVDEELAKTEGDAACSKEPHNFNDIDDIYEDLRYLSVFRYSTLSHAVIARLLHSSLSTT